MNQIWNVFWLFIIFVSLPVPYKKVSSRKMTTD
jgi:hypothetical protein